jgi:hypothetical protein
VIEHGFAHVRNQGAVEIKTEEFDSFRVQALNLGIDLADAMGWLVGTARCAVRGRSEPDWHFSAASYNYLK